jgi:hypothetical protein
MTWYIRALAAADRSKNLYSVGDVCRFEAFFLGGFSRDIDGLFTVVAQFASQTLRDYEAHRGGNRIGFDTHVDQSCQRLRRVVGMQR